jgi:hypothetical protein
MKNATTLLSIFATVILTSCAGVSPTRVIGDTAGAAGDAAGVELRRLRWRRGTARK